MNANNKPEIARRAYSRAEFAEALGISVVTVGRARNHGRIRGNFVGRVDRIPASELERVAAEGLPPIPRDYVRVTTGPTTRGRPRKTASKPKPSKATKRRRPSADQRASA